MDALTPVQTCKPEDWAALVMNNHQLTKRPDADSLNEIITQAIVSFHHAFDPAREITKGAFREAVSVTLGLFGRESSRKEAMDKAEIQIWRTALEVRIKLHEALAGEGVEGLKKAEKIWGSVIQNAVASYQEVHGRYFTPMVGKPSDKQHDEKFTEYYDRLNSIDQEASGASVAERKSRAFVVTASTPAGTVSPHPLTQEVQPVR